MPSAVARPPPEWTSVAAITAQTVALSPDVSRQSFAKSLLAQSSSATFRAASMAARAPRAGGHSASHPTAASAASVPALTVATAVPGMNFGICARQVAASERKRCRRA
jgi:hypothetical protein